FVVRGHHLQLQALTSVGHCHHCDLVIEGLAPQAYVCAGSLQCLLLPDYEI
ncbi:jg18822, partial [Pararge aegeria aegeria]